MSNLLSTFYQTLNWNSKLNMTHFAQKFADKPRFPTRAHTQNSRVQKFLATLWLWLWRMPVNFHFSIQFICIFYFYVSPLAYYACTARISSIYLMSNLVSWLRSQIPTIILQNLICHLLGWLSRTEYMCVRCCWRWWRRLVCQCKHNSPLWHAAYSANQETEEKKNCFNHIAISFIQHFFLLFNFFYDTVDMQKKERISLPQFNSFLYSLDFHRAVCAISHTSLPSLSLVRCLHSTHSLDISHHSFAFLTFSLRRKKKTGGLISLQHALCVHLLIIIPFIYTRYP